MAVEMATAYAGFGTTVTLLARSGLLGKEEPFAGEMVADALGELGASVRLGASPAATARIARRVLRIAIGTKIRALSRSSAAPSIPFCAITVVTRESTAVAR